MTRVLFESVKTETGRDWHTDHYKCTIVNNWLHLIFPAVYGHKMELDSADSFVKYRKIKRPYYKSVKYIKDNENVIEWLEDNIVGACRVDVKIDYITILDTGLPFRDIKRIIVGFTSKVDAMAFVLKWG